MRIVSGVGVLAAGLAMSLLASSANAAPLITGMFSINGFDVNNTTNQTIGFLVDPPNFTAATAGGTSGSFGPITGTEVDFFGQGASPTLLDYTNLQGALGGNPLFTGADGLSFTLTAPNTFSVGGGSLQIVATGTLTLMGFDPTPGTFNLTTQTGSGSVEVSFSATSVAVPGPIVGAGLPGLVAACGGLLALARRRRQLV